MFNDLSGQSFAHYQLIRPIGRGGMAHVYLAQDTNLRRTVAIKFLSAYGDNTELLRTLEREALTIAQMEHPNILPIYEFGEYEHRPYIVMRYIDGGSLESHMREGALNSALIRDLLRQIGRALDYAHRRGVIHRDIKPSNILMDSDDNPYLADFGIASATAASEITPPEGVIMGTPRYMAPEVIRGDSPLTPAVDIYAFACVAYEMLTGKAPFELDTPYALVMAHVYDPIPTDALPPALVPVFVKALAKQPTHRYETAGAFAEAVIGLLPSEGIAYEITPEMLKERAEAPTPITGMSVSRMEHPPMPAPSAPPARQTAPTGVDTRLVIAIIAVGAAVMIAGVLAINLFSGTVVGIGGVALLAGGIVAAGAYLTFRRSVISRPQRAEAPTLVEPYRPPPIDPDLDDTAEVDAVYDTGYLVEDYLVKPTTTAPPPQPTTTAPPPPITAPRRRMLADFNDGDMFGAYRLIKRLDTGDKNRVYHAVNTANDRPVALKLMQASNDRAVSRFKQEALILSELHHPHIVQFYDFGVDEPFLYLVMPYLTGHSLRTRLEKGALAVETVVRLTDRFASALSYIHEKSLVHRDFRPVNIVFNADDQPFLTEFSIVKRIDDENAVALTMAGEILGTPGYIAPEQRLMGEVSAASDQYSLAVVAFEMLTGTMPFDPPKNMIDNLYAKPKRAAALIPALPAAVDDVLGRGMALRPEERFPDVRAFCGELELALTRKAAPIISTPTGNGAPALDSEGHVFISYSRAQTGYARRLADHLIAGGFNVWIDDQIDYGDDWWKTIVRAIERCGAMVVIMSPEAEESEWVQREVGNALKLKKSIYPLLYAGENWALFVWTQYADLRAIGTIDPPLPPDDFLDRLAKSAKRGSAPGREVTVTPAAPSPRSTAPAAPLRAAASRSDADTAAMPTPPPPQPTPSVTQTAPMPPVPRHEIIRILFLSADPKNERRTRLSDELRSVDEYLRKSEYRDRFDLKEAWALQIGDLQGHLLRYRPHIVHFSGHGSQEGAILLQDPTGYAVPVQPSALSSLFATLKDNIRCVVLNACYSEIQARAIAEHIDCVVGMSHAIKDSSAVIFAGQFYQALGYGRHIGTAFNLGKNALELYNTGEEVTPQIILRDGLRADEIALVS